MMHLFTPYYRPSWQGGDTQQPLCCKPRVGVSGDCRGMVMTLVREDVDCPLCVLAMKTGRARAVSSAEASESFKAPPRRRNDDLKHCRAVWKASKGRMFPFVVIHLQQARAA